MIGPSRRRGASSPSRDFSLHRRLARARDRHRRLRVSVAAALFAAVLVWAFGLELPVRAASVAAVAFAAWFVPMRGSDAWALRWIGSRAGLAYQTVIETEGQADRFGLREVLEERARTGLARLEEPRHPAWWLPLLALTLGVLLLPELSSLSPAGPGSGSLLPSDGQPGSPVGRPPEQDDEIAPESLEERRARLEGEPGEAGRGARQDPEANPADGGGEQAALERFLRNVRERSDTEDREQNVGQDGSAGRADGRPRDGAADRTSGGERGEGQGLRRDGEESTDGARPGADSEEPAEDRGGEGTNPFAQAGSSEGEQTGPGDGPAEQAEPDEAGAGQQPPREQSAVEDAQAQGSEARSDEARGNEAGGTEGGAGTGLEPGEGAGAGAGSSLERPVEQGEGARGEPLFLEGDLRPGEVTPGGAIQLPGADDVELPAGRLAEDYRQEVERAVSEGRIPLEYQEIIRNYFR
jgi:hypothetical protein